MPLVVAVGAQIDALQLGYARIPEVLLSHILKTLPHPGTLLVE